MRTVTDNRGGTTRTYEIAKLADGKYWMLTNLKLGSTSESITLTPANSDVGSTFTLPQLASSGFGGDHDNPVVHGPVDGDTGSRETNYDYLYSWSAATAGATRVTNSDLSGDAQFSICPAGWRLPRGGTSGDFANLDVAFGDPGQEEFFEDSPSIPHWMDSFKSVASSIRRGAYDYIFRGQGDWNWGMLLWSSATRNDTSYSSNMAYGLTVTSGGLSNNPYMSRIDAIAVRCLHR